VHVYVCSCLYVLVPKTEENRGLALTYGVLADPVTFAIIHLWMEILSQNNYDTILNCSHPLLDCKIDIHFWMIILSQDNPTCPSHPL